MKRTPHSIANEIRMARSQFAGVYVIVEGTTDVKCYSNFTDSNDVRFIDARDKSVAIEAIRILNADQQSGILAVVDADFDRLPPRQLVSEPNLLYCDCHDIETMLILSPALNKVLREVGSPEKIRSIEQSGNPVCHHLMQAGRLVGGLRLLSLDRGYSFRFDESKYADFVADSTHIILPAAIVKAIKNHSQAHHHSDVALLTDLQSVLDGGHPDTELVCGHDLVAILAIWLRRLIGSCKPTEIDMDTIECLLRVAYQQSDFVSTNIYQEMKAWEATWGKTRLFSI